MADEKKLRELAKLVSKLKGMRGAGTELISVYIPSGYPLAEITSKLRGEHGQAANIKSKTTRKNVQGALEKIINYLKVFRKTPENGLVVFCGNISKDPSKVDIELFSISPPEPLGVQMYRCDSQFLLDPLEAMGKKKERYGLVTIDGNDATIATLYGNVTQIVRRLHCPAPAKVRKGGQCIHANTFLQLSNGQVVEVRSINKNSEILSYDFTSHTPQFRKCTDVFDRKSNKAYVLKTRYPVIQITATPEHRFFVIDGEGISTKYVEDIQEGDHLLSVKNVNFIGKPKKTNISVPNKVVLNQEGRKHLKERRLELGLSQKDMEREHSIHQTLISEWEIGKSTPKTCRLKRLLGCYGLDEKEFIKKFVEFKPLIKFPEYFDSDFCQIIGYILGDGTLDGNRIILYEGDRQVIDFYKDLIDRTFDLSSVIYKVLPEQKSKKSFTKRPYFELRVCNKILTEIFQKLFKEILESSDLRDIPTIIQELPHEQVASFLRGLYDAEGYVELGGKGPKKGQSVIRIGIGMNAFKVVGKLQSLLLRFGIVSSTYKKKTNPGKFLHFLDINDCESIRKFKKYIGFSSNKKMKRLERVRFRGERSKYTHQIPIKGSQLIKIVKELKMKTTDFPTVTNFFIDQRNMSYYTFERSILPYLIKRIKNIENSTCRDIRKFRNNLRILTKEVAKGVGTNYWRISELEREKLKDHKIERKVFNFLKEERERLLKKSQEILDLLKLIQNPNLIAVKVVDKKEIKTNPNDKFYDVAVPKNENFIANTLVIHNSQARYQRYREAVVEDYYKRVGAAMDESLFNIGINKAIIGGPGPVKEYFLKKKPFNYQFKILGIVDTGYVDEYGIEELAKKAVDIIAEEKTMREKKIIDEFMKEISKEGLATYGIKEVINAIEQGRVGTLLLSEEFAMKRAKTICPRCGKEEERYIEEGKKYECECGGELKIKEEVDLFDEIYDQAEEKGIEVVVISAKTSAGAQFLAGFKGIGALLKY